MAAQYPFDFRDESVGAVPAGITTADAGDGAWDIAQVGGENRLRYTGDTTNATRVALLDSVEADGDRSTEEILTPIYISAKDSTGTHIGATIRYSGTIGSPTYYGAFLRESTNNVQLVRVNSGSFNGLNTSVGFSWVAGTVYLMRLRVSGTGASVTLQCRVWDPASESEPGTWTVETTDSDASRITTPGSTGAIAFRSAGSVRTWTYFSVATGGLTADTLTASGDTTAPTLTSPTATATGSSTADGSVSTDEGNGTLYWVFTQSATKPSVSQIQAGQDHTGAAADDSGSQSITATGTQNVSASGLSASTTYYAHYQHKDAANNDSTVVTSSSITTTAAGTDLTFAARFDSENLDPNSSTITDAGTSTPSVTIVPRETETNGSNAWRQFLFKLENANGKQPSFTLDYTDYVTTFPTSDWRPWYTYDDPTSESATWTRWPSATTNAGTNLRGFDLGSAFTQDNVWIAFKPAYPLGRSKSFIDWLEANHSSVLHQINASIDDPNRVAATVSSQTDELGRTVPAQPLYAYGLWDPTSYPSDGLPKRPVVLAGGNHAGEHIGDHILEAFVRYLVSGTAQADALLAQYQFYVYPCLNPVGRWGGHQRGQWDPANLTKDPNRDWLDQNLESTQDAVAAFADDLSGRTVVFALTFHDFFSDPTAPVAVFYASDMLSAYQTAYETEVDSYAATDFVAGNAFTDGILEGHLNATYGCEHGYTPEAAGTYPATSLSEWTAWGEHFARALDDLTAAEPTQVAFAGNYIAETLNGSGTVSRQLDVAAYPWPPSPGDSPVLVQRGLGADSSRNLRVDSGSNTGDLFFVISSVDYDAADADAGGASKVTVTST